MKRQEYNACVTDALAYYEKAAIVLTDEEKARIEREQNPTTEDLLKQIRDILKEKN